MCKIVFGKSRSEFWITLFENEDSTCILTNGHTKNLIDMVFPEFQEMGPKGWTSASKNNFHLWIPIDRVEEGVLEALKLWAHKCDSHLWLQLNKFIKGSFQGNELDYCIAADWNFDFDNGCRTEIGESEYQLKYNKGGITRDHRVANVEIIKTGLISVLECLPFDVHSFIVTTIPATKEKQNKLSWKMAKYMSKTIGTDFVSATLSQEKPQMKEQTVYDRIQMWRDIYGSETIDLSHSVQGENIFIVDDLYQSGASIWTYSEYLKSQGARSVIGIVAVKARRDSDNK